MQRLAYNYFDSDSITYKRAGKKIPDNIIELEKLIELTQDDIIFIDSLHDDIEFSCDSLDKWILEEISNYKFKSDEEMMFEKSKNSIIYLDEYYIETVEGNHRNWLYPIEVYEEFIRLYEFKSKLNLILKEKIVNIGLEIALLRE